MGVHGKMRFVDIVVNVNARAKGKAVFFHHILATPPKCARRRCSNGLVSLEKLRKFS